MTNAPLYTDQDTLSGILSYLRETAAILLKDWPEDMNITCVDRSKKLFTLNGTCPHCGDRSVFTEVTNRYSVIDRNSFVIGTVVMQCQGCMMLILATIKYWPTDCEPCYYVGHFPLGTPNEKLAASIPADVAGDFREAIRCQWARSYRACVVMCRRALQTSAIALKAQGDTLVKQIDDLAAKGVITTPLKDFAHEIRLAGNVGAHSDGLQDIKETDAEAIMEFTREYLDHVYVMPAKLQARRVKPAPLAPEP